MFKSNLSEVRIRKSFSKNYHTIFIVPVLIIGCLGLLGCPPPAPESINITDPKDLEAHDIDLGIGLASIPISINLTSSSGRPLQVGSFQAFVTEDIPGVEPDDVDEFGDLIEEPIEITSHFSVDYQAKTATLITPVELPMAWYFLEAKVLDDLNVEASDLVVMSSDYPGQLFLGSSLSPFNLMMADLAGIHDECFGGSLNHFWPEGGKLRIGNVPTYSEVLASAPWGLLVDVQVPTYFVPSGVIQLRAHVLNNAIVFAPQNLDPIDLYPSTDGLIPCAITVQVTGVVRRTGEEEAAPRIVFQNVTVADSPSGGTCWLQQPPVGCQSILDLSASAFYLP